MTTGGRELDRVGAALDAALGAPGGGRVERDRPLGPLTTYRVGGPAALYLEAAGEADLLAVRAAVSGTGVPVLVVGRGSNLLVADSGFAGLAVRLGPGFDHVDLEDHGRGGAGAPASGGDRGRGPDRDEDHGRGGAGAPASGGDRGRGPDRAEDHGRGGAGAPAEADGHTRVRAGAATGLPVLARRAVDAGLLGLEWAVGIPGSVGGAVRMNAGGHGSDTAACLLRYRWLDLANDGGGVDGPDRLELGYRRSSLGPTQVVLWAELRARRGDPEVGRRALREIVRWRREHQPGGSNAGSVFTNPPGDSAGRLVDAAGLKGLRVGSAQVSTKHANFIQADDAGSADDVLRLMDRIRAEVARRLGVCLDTEVRLVGFDDAAPSTSGVTS